MSFTCGPHGWMHGQSPCPICEAKKAGLEALELENAELKAKYNFMASSAQMNGEERDRYKAACEEVLAELRQCSSDVAYFILRDVLGKE